MTPPAHFALSEILIVIAGAYSMRVFLQHKLNFAAAGVLVLAVAAFLATLRFGLNMHTELKSSHQLFTVLSLLFGVPLITIDVIKKSQFLNEKIILIFALIMALISIYIFFQAKSLIIMYAVMWLVLGIIFSFLIPREKISSRFVSSFIFSIILVNFIVRQVQLLEPNLSWHFYHVVVAVWLYLMTLLITKKEAKYE